MRRLLTKETLRIALRRARFVAAFTLFAACVSRPPPVLAPDFETRRPVAVAVLPVVYLPSKDSQARKEGVSSRAYQRAMFVQRKETRNKVYQGLEIAARSTLEKRGVGAVDPATVSQLLDELSLAQRIDWDAFARDLHVDALLFITLKEWSLRTQRDGQLARVDVQVELHHVRDRDVLWKDSNAAGFVRVIGAGRTNPIGYVTAKAVSSAFESFPGSQ